MHFEGSFKVPGRPEDVIRRFADVPRMARCMPGAVLEPQAEDGSWPGAMVVAFGPKKVNFKGRVTTAFDDAALTGSLHGRGSADMRAARIGVKVGFTLRPDAAASKPTTVVDIVSDAELGGVLADFARTGGVAVANVIMADFAKRATAEFAEDEAGADEGVAHRGGADTARTDTAEADDVARVGDAPVRNAAAGGRSDGGRAAVDAVAGDRAVEDRLAASEAVQDSRGQRRTEAVKPDARHAQGKPAEFVPLAAHTLLWAVVKMQFTRLGRWLGMLR